MPARGIIISLLFTLPFFISCSHRQENNQQDLESSSVELTLPQIPKISIPYKPTDKDIQNSLKNAGFYAGQINGNIDPLTEEAIRRFQAENDLVVDGKVGPKTWAVLSKYLINADNEQANIH